MVDIQIWEVRVMEGDQSSDVLMRRLKFRNYTPRSEVLQKYMEETEPADAKLLKLEEQQKVLLDAANAKFEDPTTDLENMAPKKTNWDLKGQLSSKLFALQKQTQQSLLEFVREKAKGSTGEQLAAAVASLPVELTDDEDD